MIPELQIATVIWLRSQLEKNLELLRSGNECQDPMTGERIVIFNKGFASITAQSLVLTSIGATGKHQVITLIGQELTDLKQALGH